MNDYERLADASGCGFNLFLSVVAVAAALFLLTALGGGDSTHSTGVDAEVLSRNQVNVLSDVRNEYYDCLAANSCVWYDTTNTTSTSTSTSRTEVNGERNTIIQSDGQIACEDPNNPNQYATVFCQ